MPPQSARHESILWTRRIYPRPGDRPAARGDAHQLRILVVRERRTKFLPPHVHCPSADHQHPLLEWQRRCATRRVYERRTGDLPEPAARHLPMHRALVVILLLGVRSTPRQFPVLDTSRLARHALSGKTRSERPPIHASPLLRPRDGEVYAGRSHRPRGRAEPVWLRRRRPGQLFRPVRTMPRKTPGQRRKVQEMGSHHCGAKDCPNPGQESRSIHGDRSNRSTGEDRGHSRCWHIL